MNTIISPTPARTRPAKAEHQGRGRFTRIAAILVSGIILLAATGAAYQALATAIDRRNYPAPGRMVAVGGFRMHINCTGEGSPTVVLEQGGGGSSVDWFLVQPEIAKSTRVCAYDRGGLGWSDPRPGVRDGRHIADELHALLQAAGIPGPYVLAGWSYGGLFVRSYAAQYPQDVAGLVLLDATHPDVWSRTERGGSQYQTDSKIYTVSRLLARLGLLRLLPNPLATPPASLPAQHVPSWKAVHNTTQSWDTTEAESRAILETMGQVRGASHLGSLPVLVVTAGENQGADGLWQTFQAELASSLSTNSAHHILEGAGHLSLVFDPEFSQASSRAILQVVEAARTGQHLAQK